MYARDIKFRAWDKRLEFMENVEIINFGIDVTTMNDGGASTHEWEDVVLLQFTGLKDKNGREIYEGDIVKNHYANCGSVSKVFYSDGAFRIGNANPLDEWDPKEGVINYLEVIGNIYENPELLEVKS